MFLVMKLLLLVPLFNPRNALSIKDGGKENKTHYLEEKVYREKPQLTTNTAGIVNYNEATLPKCPNGFNGITYFKDQYANYSVCYLITEPTSFPPQCPYPTTLEYRYISRYFQITDKKHWTFTNRNVSDIGKKSCYVTNGRIGAKLVPTSCTDKYPGVCAYSYDMHMSLHDYPSPTPAFSHYCMGRYNSSCVSSDIRSPSTCYCKSDTEIEELPRTAFCNKLVEITNPYQNIVLEKLLGNHERCWIGLQKNGESYQWSSTNTTSYYAFWSNNTDFNKTYGALGLEGWLLENDGALNCAICEISNEDHPQVQLRTEHNKTTNALEVEITNATGVFQKVTCFAQNSDDYKEINLSYNEGNFLVVEEWFPFTTSGYYWCKALQLPNFTPVYSNTIYIATQAGHEYAFLITVPQPDISLPEEADDLTYCESIKSSLNEVLVDSKPVKIIKRNEEDKTLEVLCHITIKPTQVSRAKEFDMVTKLLKNATAQITNLASIEACLPSVSISGGQTLHWQETPIGSTTIPEELCLQVDGSPVTRTCTGNFYYGSQWLNVNGTCANVTYSHRTHLLDYLLKSNFTTPSNLSILIVNITENTNNFTSFEIHLISKSLEKLTNFDESVNVTNITMIVNNIMHFNPSQLRDSQETLNSTDMILYSLDEMLAQTDKDDSGYTSEVTEKLVVQISDLKKTNVNGIKLGKTQTGFDPTKTVPLHYDTSKENLMKENLDLAVLIPQQLHGDIVNCVGPEASSNLIITVFHDDVLFNEQQPTNWHPDGRIISVTIPNFDCPFTAPLQIIFNSANDDKTELKCASWNYGFNDFMEGTRGQWFIESDPKTFGNSTYQVCEFRHVTHFTLLVLGDLTVITTREKALLDVTTAIIGSGLSILGLTMIFFTAIMFKNFRSADTPIILLNFSIAMTAQIVLLFVADNLTENKVLCIVFGAALHYLVLCQFCWMPTIALFQYNIHVQIGNTAPNFVAKACVCSWGIPLIPVIIILLISTDNYGRNAHGLCYAVGNYFIFGVLVPVSIMLFINWIVFILIISRRIRTRSELRTHPRMDDTLALQIKLAILLFFLLGLTWGFGLLASIDGGIVYSNLFFLTATLQGFVLFLYFIVLNEKTRTLWKNSKVYCCKCENTKAAEGGRRNPQHTDVNTNRIELLRWREGSDEDNSYWIRDSVQ